MEAVSTPSEVQMRNEIAEAMELADRVSVTNRARIQELRAAIALGQDFSCSEPLPSREDLAKMSLADAQFALVKTQIRVNAAPVWNDAEQQHVDDLLDDFMARIDAYAGSIGVG